MSSEVLLKGRGLSKAYMGISSPGAALLHALFPRGSKPSDEHPVLDSIDLDIHRGETVGIIGRNGAGKTTLLGILGGVIQATCGTVERRGKVATLLGLTAGFNHNFTGRENGYVFCSIHGLDRAQADRVIPEIEEFAELGEYFDLPMRSYSSGMQARLAFSCAAHVSADLIIIDETLAVGDANFKLKCYDRIKQMQEHGQTFLLVSHSQNLVANYCTRVIVLNGGRKVFDGDTIEGLEIYKAIRVAAQGEAMGKKAKVNGAVEGSEGGKRLRLRDFTYAVQPRGQVGRQARVSAVLEAGADVAAPAINWGIRTSQGIIVAQFDGVERAHFAPMVAGELCPLEFIFDLIMQPGRYYLSATTYELRGDVAIPQSTYQNVLSFDVPGERGGGIVDLNMRIEVPESTIQVAKVSLR